MQEKLFETKDIFGSLTLYKCTNKSILIVEPKGIINPSLVQIDLREAKKFGNMQSEKWTYLVNTEHVIFPNPLNLFFLRQIKDLPSISEYVVFAPSLVVRVLAKLTGFIIKPDRVLKTRKELLSLIE